MVAKASYVVLETPVAPGALLSGGGVIQRASSVPAQLNGGGTIVAATGVKPAGVATRAFVGRPALLMSREELLAALAVGSRAATGAPSVTSVVLPAALLRARAVSSRRAVGRPSAVAQGPGVPWVVRARGIGRRTV